METHKLKTEIENFKLLWNGRKTFEIRKNTEGFKPGDMLFVDEYDYLNSKPTGRFLRFFVTHIDYYEDYPDLIQKDCCIMSLEKA